MGFHTAADSDDMKEEASKQSRTQEHGLDGLFETTMFASIESLE